MNDFKNAEEILSAAKKTMEERGETYDKCGFAKEERSFTAVAQAFNVVTSKSIAPSDVALILMILKMVRQESSTTIHKDSLLDLTSYSALYGEEVIKCSNKYGVTKGYI